MIYSLLFILLCYQMADKTELQEIQKPMPVIENTQTGSRIGKTERPISARAQVQDRYLDTIQWYTTQIISDSVQNNIIDLTIYWTGTLKPDWTTWMIIWATWTYMIQVSLNIDAYWWSQHITLEIYNIDTRIWVKSQTVPTIWDTDMDYNKTFNLNKWDIINYVVSQDSWWDATINITATIIKLS